MKIRVAVSVLLGGVTAAALGYTTIALGDRTSSVPPATASSATAGTRQAAVPVAEVEAAGDDGKLLPAAAVLPPLPLRAPSTFDADLAVTKAIIKTDVGHPCDEGDPTFLMDPASPQPVLVAVIETAADGTCDVVGWGYRDDAQNHGLDFTLPVTNTGYILQPLFDSAGNVIRFGQPGPDIQYPNGPDQAPAIVDTDVNIVQPARLLSVTS